jgi:hypothetical protein
MSRLSSGRRISHARSSAFYLLYDGLLLGLPLLLEDGDDVLFRNFG